METKKIGQKESELKWENEFDNCAFFALVLDFGKSLNNLQEHINGLIPRNHLYISPESPYSKQIISLNHSFSAFCLGLLYSWRWGPCFVELARCGVHLPGGHLVMLLSIRLARLLRHLVLLLVIGIFWRELRPRSSALRVVVSACRRCSSLVLVLTGSSLHLRCLNDFSAAWVVFGPLEGRPLLKRSRDDASNLEELVALELGCNILQFRLLD